MGRKQKFAALFFFIGLFLFCPKSYSASDPSKSSPENFISEIEFISHRIFQNECSGKISGLLTWNDGEDFPSLGIGNFIWYPKNYRGRFTESFPLLLSYIELKGEKLPDWFDELKGRHAPWKNKKTFEKALRKGKLKELQDFLIRTQPLQAEFMMERFKNAIPQIISAAPEISRDNIRKKISLLIGSKDGLYPLIDYVNFKSEGITDGERYRGEGWGLLQVLEAMKASVKKEDILLEFSKAAEKVIRKRVKNSPFERNEIRWLPGWLNRIETYSKVKAGNEVVRNRKFRHELLLAVVDDITFTTEKGYLDNLEDFFPLPAVPAS